MRANFCRDNIQQTLADIEAGSGNHVYLAGIECRFHCGQVCCAGTRRDASVDIDADDLRAAPGEFQFEKLPPIRTPD